MRICAVLITLSALSLLSYAAGAAPLCQAVGCTIEDSQLSLPQGAQLSFSQCAEGGRESYVLVRKGKAWEVTSYEAKAEPDCMREPEEEKRAASSPKR